jgi:hypothetical protein
VPGPNYQVPIDLKASSGTSDLEKTALDTVAPESADNRPGSFNGLNLESLAPPAEGLGEVAMTPGQHLDSFTNHLPTHPRSSSSIVHRQ